MKNKNVIQRAREIHRRQDQSCKNSDPFSISEGGFKYGELDGYSYRLGWAEETVAIGADCKDIVGRSFDFSKLKIISFVVFIFLFGLIFRVGYLQIFKGDHYNLIAEGNRLRSERIEAKRGIIYDRNGKLLARNVANFLIYFIPANLPGGDDDERIMSRLASILPNVEKEELEELLSKINKKSLEAYRPLFIKDGIEYEDAMKLYLEIDDMPGVVLTNKTRREYNLYCMSLAHILGYTGRINQDELDVAGEEYLPIDYIGKTGIEYFWENELRGMNGNRQIEVDALGREKKIVSIKNSEDGKNLVLSIDIELQKKIEEVLTAHLKKLNLSKASVIAMDPNNGEILSLVSFPSYNNNVFARGIKQDEYNELLNRPDNPLFNRAISGEYPSGSTFKPVMASIALENKVIGEHTSFLSTGGISIGQWFFPDWKAGGHGRTDVRKAIAESVNTFFYYIGGGGDDFEGLGVARIVNGAKLFGLGTQTGIDLAGEADGFLPTKEWKERVKGEQWYIGDTYHLSIGQGDILVTPLQVASFTNVFANGGKLYRPHIVKKLLNGDNELIDDVDVTPVRENFIDSYNIEIVRQGMRRAITSGSASSLQAVPVAVAGKTGTAQWSTKKDPHTWFTGFAPYKNPKIVITVLVEEGGGEGGHIAVPIAREILTWYFREER